MDKRFLTETVFSVHEQRRNRSRSDLYDFILLYVTGVELLTVLMLLYAILSTAVPLQPSTACHLAILAESLASSSR